MLDCATWFVRKEPNAKDKKTNLDPIFNKEDTQKIEALYQKAIEAMSSLGTCQSTYALVGAFRCTNDSPYLTNLKSRARVG
jgi:hypothetical protein